MSSRPLSSILSILVMAGCSQADEVAPGATQIDTLDSGLVRVANSGAPSWTPETAWRFEEDLQLGTGTGEGPEQFSSIRSITSDARGMIYVLDGTSQEIRVFQPDGTFSHTIGQRGEGPGEFEAAVRVSAGPGDTIWVLDDGNGRYSAFTPGGAFVRGHPRLIAGLMSPSSGTVLDNGDYVDWGLYFPEGRFGSRGVYYPIRYSRDFTRMDSLPPIEHTWDMLPSGRLPQLWYGNLLSLAVDRAGGLWFAESREYRISRRSLEGDTTLVFTHPADAARVTESDREMIQKEAPASVLSEVMQTLPQTRPIVHGILPDNGGHLFVFVDVAGEPSGTAVDVFQDTGLYLGRMTLPTPVRLGSGTQSPIAHVTPDHLYVVAYNRFDVPFVVRLRILNGD